MTIETIKGVVGIKLGLWEVLELFLKYEPRGPVIRIARKELKGASHTLEELLKSKPNLAELEKESDDWGGRLNYIFNKMSNDYDEIVKKYVPYVLRNKEDAYEGRHIDLRVYLLPHDQDPDRSFILGHEVMQINTDNSYYEDIARDDGDSEAQDLVRTKMLEMMKLTISESTLEEQQEELTESFPELNNKKLEMFLVQNDCGCCS